MPTLLLRLLLPLTPTEVATSLRLTVMGTKAEVDLQQGMRVSSSGGAGNSVDMC